MGVLSSLSCGQKMCTPRSWEHTVTLGEVGVETAAKAKWRIGNWFDATLGKRKLHGDGQLEQCGTQFDGLGLTCTDDVSVGWKMHGYAGI